MIFRTSYHNPQNKKIKNFLKTPIFVLVLSHSVCYNIVTAKENYKKTEKEFFKMKKNVKGFIGLFTGIAAFILIGIALFVPTNPIRDTGIALHGGANVAMAFIAALLGIVAIVFGVMSRKGKDTQTGPRKAGVIIGIFAILIALGTAGICSLSQSLADYANGVPGNAISKMDSQTRQSIDKAISELEAGAAKNNTGIIAK